jgi:hypothetical protein
MAADILSRYQDSERNSIGLIIKEYDNNQLVAARVRRAQEFSDSDSDSVDQIFRARTRLIKLFWI